MRKIITLLFICFFCIGEESNCIAQANTQDSLALVDLYNSTNGGAWYKNTGWLTGPVSSWYGIALTAGGNVDHIILDSNNLVGPLPSSLGNLSQLTELSLYQNQLNSSIPTSFGNLSNLSNLLLTTNRLNGNIPAELGNLTGLIQLDLGYNNFSGSIPSSLGNLNTNLQSLVITGSFDLTGGIPLSIGHLDNLVQLDISGNAQLGGTIPDTLRNLKKLQALNLSIDGLTGPLPDWFPELPVLSHLDLSFDHFTGSIPASMGSIPNLAYLNLSLNFYFNPAATIPAELGNLSKLTYLNLSGANLTGNIPPSLGNLTNLTSLDLGGNIGLNTIPASLGNLTKLTFLGLSSDSLSGTIPTQLGNLVNLDNLALDGNRLTGAIPSSLGNLTRLTQLNLQNNQLSDTIPASLGNLVNILKFNLYNNRLTGHIPSSLGNMTKTQEFSLYVNQLSGTLPASLGNLTEAMVFNLYQNQLSGSVPASIGNLTKAYSFALSFNQFTNVPTSLGKLQAAFNINLNVNRLTFDSLEQIFALNHNLNVNPEAIVPLHLNGNQFSVYAGGTLANDTFHWYKDNVLYQTITGDSTLTVTVTGNYSVQVTNNIITPATGLILISDTLNSNGITPITFVSFTGKAVNNTSLLQWQSANEVNTSYFKIQRSSDGIHFTDIGKVKAAGNSVSLNNYSFTDNTPANGTNYYRLKETDIDGAFSYSIIISVDFMYGNTLMVYPNPAHDIIYIHLPSSSKASVLSFYDAQGKLAMEQTVKSNTTVQQVNVSKLAAGVYYINCNQEKRLQVLKLLKQ